MVYKKRRMINTISLVALISVFSLGCQKDIPISPIYGKLGENFTLQYKQHIILKNDTNDSLKVKFTDLEELRCPKGHKCLSVGLAKVDITLSSKKIEKLNLQLSTHNNPKRNLYTAIDTFGYKIKLIKLEPYPKDFKENYDKTKYKATLNIST